MRSFINTDENFWKPFDLQEFLDNPMFSDKAKREHLMYEHVKVAYQPSNEERTELFALVKEIHGIELDPASPIEVSVGFPSCTLKDCHGDNEMLSSTTIFFGKRDGPYHNGVVLKLCSHRLFETQREAVNRILEASRLGRKQFESIKRDVVTGKRTYFKVSIF